MTQRNAGGTLGETLGQIMAIREKPGKPESSLQLTCCQLLSLAKFTKVILTLGEAG